MGLWWLALAWAAEPTTVAAEGGTPGALTILSARHTDAGLVVEADVGHDGKAEGPQYVGMTVTTGFGGHLHAPVVELAKGEHRLVSFTVPDASFAVDAELARWNRKLACGPNPAPVPKLDPEPEYDWEHDCRGSGPNACEQLGYAVCDRQSTQHHAATMPVDRWDALRADGSLRGQPVTSAQVADGAQLASHERCRLFASNGFLVVMNGPVPYVLARHGPPGRPAHSTWFPDDKALLVQHGDTVQFFTEAVAPCFGGA